MKPSDYIERGWCQCAAATDHLGHPTMIDADDAVCWCISGAIYLACAYDYVIAKAVVDEVVKALQNNVLGLNPTGIKMLTRWNDWPGRKKEEVLAVLRALGY